MEWTQTSTILSVGIGIGLAAVTITVVLWAVNKLDNDIKIIAAKIDGHRMLINQLYEIIISMLKEGKK